MSKSNSKKLSSYQKLKLENQRLKNEIKLMITKPDSIEGNTLILSYCFKYNVSSSIWLGDFNKK